MLDTCSAVFTAQYALSLKSLNLYLDVWIFVVHVVKELEFSLRCAPRSLTRSLASGFTRMFVAVGAEAIIVLSVFLSFLRSLARSLACSFALKPQNIT